MEKVDFADKVSFADRIVKTQLIPPKVPHNVLRRDRLLRELDQNLDKRLILITAGAGYGKTTLLAQFVNEILKPLKQVRGQGDKKFVFYTISESDGNLVTFFSYIITGIRDIYPRFGSRTQSLLLSMPLPGTGDVEMIIGTFINELLEAMQEVQPQEVRPQAELFIILEDYHLIDKIPAINSAIKYLLEHIPSNVQLVISSRSALPFSVARLRAKAHMLELTGEELKFTGEEIRLLFTEIYKLSVPEPLLIEIEKRSEGWITVLQLASHIIGHNPSAVLEMFPTKWGMDYFASEVFDQQPPLIQSFLVRSSILEQMTPEACDAILGSSGSNEMLNVVVKKNLFISCIDEHNRIFRYHPLFRQFLLNRLAKEVGTPSLAKSLHIRAGNYFESIKDWRSSINHYLLANDVSNAVRILKTEGDSFVDARHFDIVRDWLAKLPEYIIQKNPTLLLYQADLCHWQGQFDMAIRLYKQAKTKFMREGKIEEAVKSITGIASVLVERGLYTEVIKMGQKALSLLKKESAVKAQLLNEIGGAYYYLGEYRRAISIATQGLKVCKKIGNIREEKELLQNLSTCYLMLGEYDKAIDVCNEIISREGAIPEHPVGWSYLNLGLMYALKGEFVRSRTSLREALRRHRIFNDIRGISMSFRMLGFLNLMMGNYKLCRSYCGRGLRLNIRIGDKALNEQALHDISRAYLLEGKLVEAEDYINKIIPYKGTVGGKGLFLITKGHIELELGNLAEAESILKFALSEVSKSQSKDDLMLANAVLSKLYYRQRDYELAIKHLKPALKICKEGRYHLILLKLGKIDAGMLKFAINNGIEPHYTSFILKELEPEYDLKVKFFGGLEIRTADDKIVAEQWKRQKAKSLFCYLLSNRGKSFTTDQLIEAVWPGKSLSKARSSLWQSLSSLRDTIKSFTKKGLPLIEHKSGCYGISSAYRIWLDFEEFERLISEARQSEIAKDEHSSINKYETAINLYKGDFLMEMYESWSEDRLHFYKELYSRALDKVAGLYLRERNFEKAIEYSMKAITTDKLDESAYLVAMRSYIAIGNRTTALELYKNLEQTLKEELNTEPSREIRKLFHELT